MNYYNEFEPYAAQWVRNLIAAGLIPFGHVDTRSIVDVQPSDLIGYTQCHFFAGIGGWSLAARLAGWPDDRELWTGSAPCQPFSVAGKGKAQADDRHLWPHLFRLARARRPAVLMGEQVAAAVGKDWIDGVFTDLEGIGYACGASVVPACSVDAPHRRDRLWFVAHAHDTGLEGQSGHVIRSTQGWREPAGSAAAAGVLDRAELAGSALAHADGIAGGQSREIDRGRDQGGGTQPRAGLGCGNSSGAVANTGGGRLGEQGGREVQQSWGAEALSGSETDAMAHPHSNGCEPGNDPAPAAGHGRAAQPGSGTTGWGQSGWITGHDGKARRVPQSGIRLLAHGLFGRMAIVRPGFEGRTEDPEALHWYSRQGALKAFGNAIVPQVAAEVIGAYMDCYPEIQL